MDNENKNTSDTQTNQSSNYNQQQQNHSQQPNPQQYNNQQAYNQPNNRQYQSSYQNQQYNQNYNSSQNNYGNSQLEAPMSLGDWIITMIIVAIPCVNIIMLFIWAFGHNTNTNKKNYSRATLIFMLISAVLGLIFSSIIISSINSLAGGYY
jgi:DNA mismatch repair ATPase MutL